MIPLNRASSRLQPPSGLGDAEREVFIQTVAACDAGHFLDSDLPLLLRYVEASALAAEAAHRLQLEGPVQFGKPSAWLIVAEKAVRSMLGLSARLRLGPQYRKRNIAPPTGASYYERQELMGDDAE